MAVVEVHSGKLIVSDAPCWHLVSPAWAWMFHNNVRVASGALLSVSEMIQGSPQMSGTQTPYSMGQRDGEKEQVFEKVRLEKYPLRPSRQKGLFVFDDYALVERAQREWFPNGKKLVYECRLSSDAAIHKADAQLLNSHQAQWEASAHRYWAGEMTEQPFPEVVVRGTLYFPGWKSFPRLC